MYMVFQTNIDILLLLLGKILKRRQQFSKLYIKKVIFWHGFLQSTFLMISMW